MRSSKAATPIRFTISACIARTARPWCARSCRRPPRSRPSTSTATRLRWRVSTMPACSRARCRTAPSATSCAPGSATTVVDLDDPYRFPPVLTDFDLYLLGEGTHQRLYDKLGAHPMTLDGVDGVAFVVLAPNARRVSVVGDFNFWNPRRHPMRVRGVGYWELFVPRASAGDHYKFDIIGPQRPASAAEVRPDGVCRRDAPEHRLDRSRRDQAAASAPRTRRHQRAERADVDLRGASRLLAAQGQQRMADLPRARRAAAALCPRSRLYPCRVSAGQRTSVRRLLGLSADRHVRADQPVRHAGGFCRA